MHAYVHAYKYKPRHLWQDEELWNHQSMLHLDLLHAPGKRVSTLQNCDWLPHEEGYIQPCLKHSMARCNHPMKDKGAVNSAGAFKRVSRVCLAVFIITKWQVTCTYIRLMDCKGQAKEGTVLCVISPPWKPPLPRLILEPVPRRENKLRIKLKYCGTITPS